MSIKDYENEIVNSCIESSSDPSTYFCIVSELYGMNQVLHIFRSQSTYTVDQWKYFLTLLVKHSFGNGFDWVRIDIEFHDYLNQSQGDKIK